MRILGRLTIVSIAAVTVGLGVLHAAAADRAGTAPVPCANVRGKKLIRWAAEITNKTRARDVPAKVAVWQDAGYDGLCFNISSHRDGSTPEALQKGEMFFRWWSLIKRDREEFVPDIEAFKSVRDWGRLTDNFLLTAVRPLYSGEGRCPDWFNDEDTAIVLGNTRLAARIARELGFKGIVFDVEAYGWAAKGAWSNPWSYERYAADWYQACGHETPLPFAQVSEKLRQRGREWAEALSAEFPDIVVLVAPGLYDVAWAACVSGRGASLADSGAGLWPAFVDGLLAGLSADAQVVSLCERTYIMSQYVHMAKVRDIVKRQSLVLSGVPDLARRRISFAVGLWTDAAYGRTGGFSNTDAKANHRNPVWHEHATANALAASDHYAWHYGEASYFLQWGEGYPFRPDFDKRYDEPPALISEYWRANRRGREPHDLDWIPQPDSDMADHSEFDANAAKQNAAVWKAREAEGYEVVAALPEYWRFLFDYEMLGRCEPYSSSLDSWSGTSWFSVSSHKCWQSQGVKANGNAWYGAAFDVPADLDLADKRVFLAFGPVASYPVNIYLNGGWIAYLPKHPMPDVTDRIKPGQENLLVLGFINKTGPGGLAGDVKLLSRANAPE